MDCLSDQMEQVVILERWPGNEVRSWIATSKVAARGPLDDRLVAIPIFSSHVVGLGVCSSGAGGVSGVTARVVDVRSITESSDGPVSVSLGIPDPITRGVGGADAAMLYGAPGTVPPKASVGRAPVDGRTDRTGTPSLPRSRAPSTWPTGSYAIAFSFPSDGAGVVRWLRIDLIHGAGSAG